uniref:Alpha-mannosidase n=1 Tax=Thermofilum pendens TaxID=2269 RepID=A0A7J3X7W8_THEPE
MSKPLRSYQGVRAKLFYVDAASTLRFSEVPLSPCGSGLCGEVEVEGGEGFLLVDLVGEATLRVGDYVYAVYRVPGGGHENRFVPIPGGRSPVALSPSARGPFGERLFDVKGAYLYVKEPEAFGFVVHASLLADLGEMTGDTAVLSALNKALDQVTIESLAGFQLEAAAKYSVVKPPFYVGSLKYYGISLDPELQPMDPGALSRMAREARRVLEEELEKLRRLQGRRGVIYAVGHAHIDAAWLWPPDVTRDKVVRTLSNVLTLSKRYPMRFAFSQVLYLDWLEKTDPELFRRVLEAVRSGVVVPVGGMWVESDTNVVGGESLVRQLLYGQRRLVRLFGKPTEVGWLPDSFGYTASLPQILAKAGVRVLFTHKMRWNKQNRFPYTLFLWEGVDGTRLLTVNYLSHGGDLSPRQLAQAWEEHTSPSTPAFLAFGHGDGGGGPTWLMMERLKAYGNAPGCPQVVLATPQEYLEAVQGAELPVWKGELYLEMHRGTYSTGTKLKKLLREVEEALKDLEVVSYMCGVCRSYEYLWLPLLEACFHDVASATVTEEVYNHYVSLLEDLRRSAEAEIKRALESALGGGDWLVVVNTLPWEREDAVPAPVEGAVQQVIDGRVYSLVRAPPMGFASYREGVGAEGRLVEASAERVSNGLVEVRSDGSIHDLEAGVEAVSRSYLVACEDIPAEWDGWDLDPWYQRNCVELHPVSVELVERGPLRACLEFRYEYGSSTLSERVCVWSFTKRVDYRLRGSIKHRLVVFRKVFELGFQPVAAEAEIPYGVVRRSLGPENPWEAAKFEFPVWRWLDVYSAGYGVAFLNKGRPGHSLSGRLVGITIAKTPVFPNPKLDLGEVEAEYAVYPHPGTWREAQVPRRALEYHRPLRVLKGRRAEGSFMRIDAPNLLVETVKCAEDGRGFIARIWETYGSETELELEAEEMDFLELGGRKAGAQRFKPFEIKSLRLTR